MLDCRRWPAVRNEEAFDWNVRGWLAAGRLVQRRIGILCVRHAAEHVANGRSSTPRQWEDPVFARNQLVKHTLPRR
jgi:hypothetical protein